MKNKPMKFIRGIIMNKLMDWGGPVFVRVSKKKYENFCRYFKDKLEFNDFMGWNDAYDFS